MPNGHGGRRPGAGRPRKQQLENQDRPALRARIQERANCIVLMESIRERRPEIKCLSRSLHVTLDSEHGVVLVGLAQPDGQVVLIERIIANPHEPATFGQSELPLKVQQQRMH